METRANYILIGAFTIAGILGMLGFFLWFARVELDRQFAYYDVRFDTVSGLSRAADVRFSGLPVGRVVDVSLAPDRDGSVMVRVEVRGDTPVRADSTATIESQGVTGVAFVAISPGSPEAALMPYVSGEPVPQLVPGRSFLQTLTEDAPEVLEQFLRTVDQVNQLLGPENQAKVNTILGNLETASGEFSQALSDFSVVASSVSGFAIEISLFNEMLEGLTGSAQELFATAGRTLDSVTEVVGDARATVEEGTRTLAKAGEAIDSAQVFIAEDLRRAVAEIETGVREARAQIDGLSGMAGSMIGEFSAAGTAATARLSEAEQTLAATDLMIARMNEVLESVDEAATGFGRFMDEDAVGFVADARAMLTDARVTVARISEMAETDLPAMVADIRATTDSIRTTAAQVGADLTSASGQVDTLIASAAPLLETMEGTFARANRTLEEVDAALNVGSKALSAAERAFAGADRVLNEDVAAITADLRGAIARLDGAIAQVSDDLPAVTADLRAAAATANEALSTLGRIAQEAGTPLREFATTGLPQYTRVAAEASALVRNLDKLVAQIQRDPARFFIGRSTPEFRR